MAAKRSNPFIEDFMPQSKVHIGLKQFNNNEDRLRKVYEKTLELLFKGAKRSPMHNFNNRHTNVVNKRDGMKQLVIGRDGSLVNNEVKVQCYYCERVLCASCQCLCSQCEKYYCSQCSLIRFEGAEMCVSCYGS